MISRSDNRELYHDLVNRDKIRGLLAENKITQNDLAKELDITAQALSNKLNSYVDFTEHETYSLYKKWGAIIFLE